MKNKIIFVIAIIVLLLSVSVGQGINSDVDTTSINRKSDPWWDYDWFYRNLITIDHTMVDN